MADDPKKAIEELQAEQEKLQDKFDKAQASFHAMRDKYAKAKQNLIDFNAKYGRMLKLIVVNEEAEAATEERETVTVGPDDVETVDITDTAGDTTEG